MNKDVSILGGGISGITTALTLQLLGYDTVCYAEHLIREDTPDDPRFSSLYPAASVIPHSITTGRLELLLPPSHEIFHILHRIEFPGMRMHRHYELFEYPVEDPSYAGFMRAFNRIEEAGMPQLPKRPGAGKLHGWLFDCFVTEWPAYPRALYKLYRQSGGTLIQKRLDPAAWQEQLPTDIIVNCTGIWSAELFEDEEPRRVVRGHLLQVKNAPPVRDRQGSIPSYNYSPGAEIYSDPEGVPADVYFYPRSNGWVLGGSRQKGILDGEGHFRPASGEPDGEPPPQIMNLNREILAHTYGIDLNNHADVEVKKGYRYLRRFNGEGLRLEKVRERSKNVIHNYGHGGAGVTISWGCALRVADMVAHPGGKSSQKGSPHLLELLKEQISKAAG